MEKTTEWVEWLCAEVMDMGGTAVLWKAECLSPSQEKELITRFRSKSVESYEKIQDQISRKPDTGQDEWLNAIIRQYADDRYHDYFSTYQQHTIHTQMEIHYAKIKKERLSK
jgi:hypothetical protein